MIDNDSRLVTAGADNDWSWMGKYMHLNEDNDNFCCLNQKKVTIWMMMMERRMMM